MDNVTNCWLGSWSLSETGEEWIGGSLVRVWLASGVIWPSRDLRMRGDFWQIFGHKYDLQFHGIVTIVSWDWRRIGGGHVLRRSCWILALMACGKLTPEHRQLASDGVSHSHVSSFSLRIWKLNSDARHCGLHRVSAQRRLVLGIGCQPVASMLICVSTFICEIPLSRLDPLDVFICETHTQFFLGDALMPTISMRVIKQNDHNRCGDSRNDGKGPFERVFLHEKGCWQIRKQVLHQGLFQGREVLVWDECSVNGWGPAWICKASERTTEHASRPYRCLLCWKCKSII